nr:hypothetical protein OG781_41675 [Streptomyces sp. NBC_00830]
MAETRSLEQLQTPDIAALKYGPYGLGGSMPSEKAAEFLQSLVADYDLASDVAKGTRREFLCVCSFS